MKTLNKEKISRLSYVMVLLLCIYILWPLFEIAQYNRPSADDYSYGILTRAVLLDSGGFAALLKAAFDTVVRSYTTLSGLYTSAFILSLHPGIWGEQNYVWSTAIICGVLYFLLFWSVYILNKHYIKRSVLFVVTATLTLLTVLVLWLPSAWQALYWYNGAMNYMPFAFMNILNLCLMIEVDGAVYSRKGKCLLLTSMILSFLISGGNHVTAFANILMMTFFAGYKLIKRKYYVLLPLAISCIGFLVMYFSPGTRNRQNYFTEDIGSNGVVDTIIATIKHLIYVAGDWISLTWILSMVVITPIALEIAYKNKKKFSKQFPIIPIVMSGAVISGMFCVPYLPMGYFGEGRVTNVIWVTFMALSWMNYVLIWGWLSVNDYVNLDKILNAKNAGFTGVLTVFVCLIALLRCHDDTMSVSMWATHELETGIAEAYAQQMDERIAKYNDMTLDEVAVEPISEPSDLLFWGEILEDPQEWPNVTMGEWYGGKSIYLIPNE